MRVSVWTCGAMTLELHVADYVVLRFQCMSFKTFKGSFGACREGIVYHFNIHFGLS